MINNQFKPDTSISSSKPTNPHYSHSNTSINPSKPPNPQPPTHNQNKPEPPSYKPHPLKMVKPEPTSPTKQKGPISQQNIEKRWKRKSGRLKGAEGTEVQIGSKRKEDNMDIDSENFGAVKKTKNTHDDTSISTAAAAEQSRQAL